MILISMLLLGALIGFVGAGGAGVTITLLTVGFNIPIHIALGVALSSMVFTMLSGVISHLRENEVELKTGLIIGLGGIVGAFVGAKFSTIIPENILSIFTKCERKAPKFIYGDISLLKNNDSILLFFIVLYF